MGSIIYFNTFRKMILGIEDDYFDMEDEEMDCDADDELDDEIYEDLDDEIDDDTDNRIYDEVDFEIDREKETNEAVYYQTLRSSENKKINDWMEETEL